MSAPTPTTALFVAKYLRMEVDRKPTTGTLSFRFADDEMPFAEAERILAQSFAEDEDGADFLVVSITREDPSNSNNWTGVPVARF